MPRICYQVAASLDGYIAGPGGEYDWIPMDPEIDFAAMFARFDTFLMGRGTYEVTGAGGGSADADPGARTYVFSRTLQPEDHPEVTIVREVSAATLDPIRARAEKDIWLFGGGALLRSFLEKGLVDAVEVAVVPVLLGGGIPLLPAPAPRTKLALVGQRTYGSGIVQLEYAVEGKK